jgi:hypothetical protein
MKGIGKSKQDAEECLRGLQRQRRRQGSVGRTMSEKRKGDQKEIRRKKENRRGMEER